jgi:hypothetical protein
MLEQTTVMTILQHIDGEVAKKESIISCAAIEREQLQETRKMIAALSRDKALQKSNLGQYPERGNK